MEVIAGIDIGGTFIKYALVDETYKIIGNGEERVGKVV